MKPIPCKACHAHPLPEITFVNNEWIIRCITIGCVNNHLKNKGSKRQDLISYWNNSVNAGLSVGTDKWALAEMEAGKVVRCDGMSKVYFIYADYIYEGYASDITKTGKKLYHKYDFVNDITTWYSFMPEKR